MLIFTVLKESAGADTWMLRCWSSCLLCVKTSVTNDTLILVFEFYWKKNTKGYLDFGCLPSRDVYRVEGRLMKGCLVLGYLNTWMLRYFSPSLLRVKRKSRKNTWILLLVCVERKGGNGYFWMRYYLSVLTKKKKKM